MNKILAVNKDGLLTYCTSPEDKRGKGRCNHIDHKKENETEKEFILRIKSIDFNNLDENNIYNDHLLNSNKFTIYRMTQEEKDSLTKITGRKDLSNEQLEGGYIELDTPLWNDMDKNMLTKLTGIKRNDINKILNKELYIVTYFNEDIIKEKNLKIGSKYILDNENNNKIKLTYKILKEKYGNNIELLTGVEGLNKYASLNNFEATKNIYVLPYYMRPNPPDGESKHPLNGMYNQLIIKKKDPNAQQKAYEQLLDNEHCSIPLKGFGGFYQKGLSNMFKGKGGIMRKYMSGRNIAYSGRAIITPDPDQEYGEIKIPPLMACEIFKPTISDYLIRNKNYNSEKLNDFFDKYNKNQKSINEEDIKELENIIIKTNVRAIANRQPSLYNSSLLSFKTKISPDGTIKINPLNVTGYGADFDGDQMSIYGINSNNLVKIVDKELDASTIHGTNNPSFIKESIIKPTKEAKWGLLNILSKRTN